MFHGRRHPRELGFEHVEAFLSYLAVKRNVAASTQNQAKSALLFLYKEILGVELPWLDDVESAKRPQRLPVVLTYAEVDALLSGCAGRTAWSRVCSMVPDCVCSLSPCGRRLGRGGLVLESNSAEGWQALWKGILSPDETPTPHRPSPEPAGGGATPPRAWRGEERPLLPEEGWHAQRDGVVGVCPSEVALEARGRALCASPARRAACCALEKRSPSPQPSPTRGEGVFFKPAAGPPAELLGV